MQNFVNLGLVRWGQCPDGWRTSLLSPFGKLISQKEWEDEGWKDSDLQFEQQDLTRQRAIKRDYIKYFEGFGDYFLVFHMNEPHPPLGNGLYFEPLIEPILRRENLTCFIDDFLAEKSQTFVFHLGRECFVSFGHDMSVLIYHKADLPDTSGLDVLKLVEV